MWSCWVGGRGTGRLFSDCTLRWREFTTVSSIFSDRVRGGQFGEASVTAPPSVHMLFSGSWAERGRPWTIRCFGQPWDKVQRHTNLFENPQRIDTLTLTGTSSRSANFVMTGTGPSDLVPKGRLLAVVRSLSRPYPGRSQRSRQSQSLRGGWIPERAKGGRCPAHCRGRCC